MKKVTLKKIKELRQEFLNDTFSPEVPKRNKKHIGPKEEVFN